MDNHSPDFSWVKISDEHIDEFESILGRKAAVVGGIYWRQVRFGFYRPLLQFRDYPVGTITPRLGSLGAAQFGVTQASYANSILNCLFFEHTSDYCIEQLDQNRSRQVRAASKRYVIRPVTSIEEFSRKGHSAYLSFYERTKYQYGSARRDPAVFARWAQVLFGIPEILVLGAYEDGELVGASLSYLSEDTVCYAAFFCGTDPLKHFVSDLMLHAVRCAAARHGEVRRVFAGMYKGHEGLDRFYLLRGAERVKKPAFIKINPILRTLLQHAAPRTFSKLMGHFA